MSTLGSKKSDVLLNDVFSGYDAAGGQLVDGSVTTIPIDTEHFQSSVNYTLVGSGVRVGMGGRIELGARVGLANTSSSARTEVQAWVAKNGVEVPGTRMLLYLRTNGYGDQASALIFLEVEAGDIITIEAQETPATGSNTNAVANASGIAVRYL
jgi:hypothetical protein